MMKGIDFQRVKVLPLARRRSLSAIGDILVDPAQPPRACPPGALGHLDACVAGILAARGRGAAVILMYGAHLIKNGGMSIVNALVNQGWITHLATNGAGTIHDWELAFLGRTEESVRENVATGTFGAWDETGRYINLAVLAAALAEEGYGRGMGRFIEEDGLTLPSTPELEDWIRAAPGNPLTPAWADLLRAMLRQNLPAGRLSVRHHWKATSMIANAFRANVPFTVHPGIGYDIFATHPLFAPAAIGRAAGVDFQLFGQSVDQLEGGVLLSVGSAIMAPQVFEKTLSCVNNLRLQAGRPIVRDHQMFVVDIQDGGNWDWSRGEPPKDNPAYYLRFCKTFARMGGVMRYVQCDNVTFLHHTLARLSGA